MRWTKERILICIEYFYPLTNYELNIWQEIDNSSGESIIRGKGGRFRAPFEMQAILNAEFERAIKSLGDLGSQVFRLCVLGIVLKPAPPGDELAILCGGRAAQEAMKVRDREGIGQVVILTIEEAIKRIDYPVRQILRRRKTVKKDLINYLLESER